MRCGVLQGQGFRGQIQHARRVAEARQLCQGMQFQLSRHRPQIVASMLPIIGRSITPTQAIPNDVDDTAENTAVIDTRNTLRLREQRLMRFKRAS